MISGNTKIQIAEMNFSRYHENYRLYIIYTVCCENGFFCTVVQNLFFSNYDDRNASESLGPLAALQTDGLTLLLLSKVLNTLLEPEHSCHDKVDEFGILPSQRILAEVTEMIQIAFLVHSGVVNTENTAGGGGGNRAGCVATPGSDTELENTMLVLGGDFLLARASKGLARLMNTQVR